MANHLYDRKWAVLERIDTYTMLDRHLRKFIENTVAGAVSVRKLHYGVRPKEFLANCLEASRVLRYAEGVLRSLDDLMYEYTNTNSEFE